MKSVFISVFITLTLFANAQLSGTFTIGGANPDYPTFNAAIADLESNGVNGSVTFNVRNGVYTDTFHIHTIAGTGPSANITFQSESGDSTDVVLAYPSDPSRANWQITDGNYLTFRSMTFRNSSSTAYSYVWKLNGTSANIRFENCHFSSARPQFDNMLYFALDQGRDITLVNNYFEECYSAIKCIAFSDSIYDVTIENNEFNTIQYPIYAQGMKGMSIHNNRFSVESDNTLDINSSTGITISENVLDTVSGIGMLLLNTGSAVIENNLFRGYVDGGIIGEDLSGSFRVSGNWFDEVLSNTIDLLNFENAIIEDNTVGILTANGITLTNGSSATVNRNIIREPFDKGIYIKSIYGGSVGVADNKVFAFSNGDVAYGIGVDNVFPDSMEQVIVTGNQIFATDEFTGLYVEELIGNSQKKSIVSNNMISGFDYNINIRQSRHVLCAHNTLSSFGDAENAVFAEQNSDISFMNNIISFWNNASVFDVIELDDTFALLMNYNVYYYNNFTIGGSLTSIAEDLFEHQALGMGLNSQWADPEFYNDTTDLRICNQSLAMAGIGLQEVPLDLYGSTRNTTMPTVGAYEMRDVTAGFSYTATGSTVTFTNSSSNASTYLWDFGDENGTSNNESPTYLYFNSGIYDVRLIALNPCGQSDTIVQQVNVMTTSMAEFEAPIIMNVYPNPGTGIFNIKPLTQTVHQAQVRIFNQIGQLVHTEIFNLSVPGKIDLTQQSRGVYLMEISIEDKRQTQKIIIQ